MSRRIGHAEWDDLKAHSEHNLNNPLWLGGGHCLDRVDVSDRPDLTRGWWFPLRGATYVGPGEALRPTAVPA